ncbi:hypothetical protein EB796_008939 [Bugula neritina]|uniref:Uncharacterized protein n=1 Tax=Bugula neritina TaxID=10212 RepID=A0A7J7K280_BUGNE|nr:hypothetical protein EB796_008939 [Bugula neritina]
MLRCLDTNTPGTTTPDSRHPSPPQDHKPAKKKKRRVSPSPSFSSTNTAVNSIPEVEQRIHKLEAKLSQLTFQVLAATT